MIRLLLKALAIYLVIFEILLPLMFNVEHGIRSFFYWMMP